MCPQHLSSFELFSICARKDLDLNAGSLSTDEFLEISNLSFFSIVGVSNFWDGKSSEKLTVILRGLLSAFARHGVNIVFLICGDSEGINVSVGVNSNQVDSLKTSFISMFPGITIAKSSENSLANATKKFGGIFTGIPSSKNLENKAESHLENICRGMLGSDFTYVVIATGLSKLALALGHDKLMAEMGVVYENINKTITGGAQGNISAQKQDFGSKNYFEALERIDHYLKAGVSNGMWNVSGYYAANSQSDAKRLASLIQSNFSGEDSQPEPFRTLEYIDISKVLSNSYTMMEGAPNADFHPIGRWFHEGIRAEVKLNALRFQTMLNSDQLALLMQMPTQEFPGYHVDHFVEFDVASRSTIDKSRAIDLGDICFGVGENVGQVNNKYLVDLDDLTRHALIIGITGGGKTNTAKSLLCSLWKEGVSEKSIPFMVVESAKREYWEIQNIKGFDDLMIFTLGDESSKTSVKYRINPFETLPEISLQTHIDYLLSTFKAAFEMFPPMPYVLETAVYEVYSDRGWDITENVNRFGLTEYPTLQDLYDKIEFAVDNMGYHEEIESNVKTALQARINSLMIGGKGAMLNCRISIPIEKLLHNPVILELEDLGDDETKSFVIGMVLVQLYEYRKSKMSSGSKKLEHVLVIEEAHRLLKKVPENAEGSRASAVEFFCNMLAEIRTFGQAIIIADQIPTKLASDTVKNTNLKIVHRTVSKDDREIIGNTMNMTEDQIDYLSSLKRGYAAVYSEGDNRPKCVKFPLIDIQFRKSRAEVIQEVRKKTDQLLKNSDNLINKHIGCRYCDMRCNFGEEVLNGLTKMVDIEKVLKIWIVNHFNTKGIQYFIDSPKWGVWTGCNTKKRCVVGYILESALTITDGERQKYFVDYLKSQFEN